MDKRDRAHRGDDLQKLSHRVATAMGMALGLPYSTDDGLAFLLFQRMRRKGWNCAIRWDTHAVTVVFSRPDGDRETDAGASCGGYAEAMCRAILEATREGTT